MTLIGFKESLLASRDVKILQIKLHHSNAASMALILFLGATNIILLQEPFVIGVKMCGIGTLNIKVLCLYVERTLSVELTVSDICDVLHVYFILNKPQII